MSGTANRREFSGTSGVEAGSVGLTENGARVLETRYLKKDESGACVERAEDLFRRVAGAVADAELLYGSGADGRSEWEDRFYNLMVTRRFLPNSPTLMNAGRELGMLSACFVLPVPDSVDGIFDSIKHTALIQKAGGGTGFAFDELRPTGDYISSSGGRTSGPISFWRAFSEVTNAIQQGAFRRGANMGMMNIDHPDVLKFLHAKEDLDQFTNYNISVKISDEWMDGFLRDPNALHIVRNPRNDKRYYLPKSLKIWEYDIRSLPTVEKADVATGDFYSKQDLWNIIINNAWRTGEPGMAFIDRINEFNPTPHIGEMRATNPCGEQPLLPYEACNLGSVNLAPFVTRPHTSEADINWDELRTTIHESTRFLDNVIDVNRYPLPEIEKICNGNRKIGIGIMGFADALFLLGVGYDTADGLAWGERIMKFVNDESHACSQRLAEQRGSFPNWEGSVWDTEHHRPMRNATCTTVAPTGTISIIAGCSCGVEPLYNLVFYRNVLREQDRTKPAMIEINPIFEHVARSRGMISEGMMDRIAKEGTLADIADIDDDMRRIFVCAHDVSPQWHVRMQAAFQKHCDAAISKTINFGQSAKVEDVDAIYRDAYKLKCKGVTVYRDGCRKQQPMALKEGDKQSQASSVARPLERPVPEPQQLSDIACGVRIRQITPFGNMHVQITVDPATGRELEVFAQLGKGGDLATSDLEAICRLISLWLRSGGNLHHVVRQLKGIGSSLQVPTKEGKITSLGDSISRALDKYQRAKRKLGLQRLILGDYTPADLEPAGSNGHGSGSNGSGNGNGNGNGNGHGSAAVEIARETTSQSSSRLAQLDGAGDLDGLEEHYKVICPDCQNPLRFGEGCIKCACCGYSQC
jgi:ribonucleoside-diphosphate reductase alpha chain